MGLDGPDRAEVDSAPVVERVDPAMRAGPPAAPARGWAGSSDPRPPPAVPGRIVPGPPPASGFRPPRHPDRRSYAGPGPADHRLRRGGGGSSRADRLSRRSARARWTARSGLLITASGWTRNRIGAGAASTTPGSPGTGSARHSWRTSGAVQRRRRGFFYILVTVVSRTQPAFAPSAQAHSEGGGSRAFGADRGRLSLGLGAQSGVRPRLIRFSVQAAS